MPSTAYIVSAIALSGVITLLIRALPFAVLSKLRKSKYVTRIGAWMPVGIMLILAVVTARNAVVDRLEVWWLVPIALAVTVAVHYLTKRKTLWSVFAGTTVYVVLLNLVS